jgi:hypothetical protein
MMTNELLEEKYRAQRALTAEGGDDLQEYARNLQRIVRETECKYGLRFRYRRAKVTSRARRTAEADSRSHEAAT